MKIRKYSENDVPAMVHIWNEVVEEGVAFPQLELLDEESGRAFFAAQTYCGVADDNGTVVGLYILHPNNVGRCGHIANASYAVDSGLPGKAYRRTAGFRLPCTGQKQRLQANAVQCRG